MDLVKCNSIQILNQKTYDLAGNILTETDALGNETSYTYDAMNRLLTSTDARGGIVQYTYDVMGNLKSIADERNKVTSFEYDARDRLVERIDPNLFVDEYEYDASGNMIAMTDRNGSEMTYDYDGLNRMTQKAFLDGTRYLFEYDPNDNLSRALGSDSSLAFNYDGSNRLIGSETQDNKTVPNIILSYTYDKNDNILSVRDSVTLNEGQILYDYDESNRLIQIGQDSPTDPAVIKFNYNRLNQRIQVIYPNDTTTNYTYTPGKPNRLRELTHQKSTGSSVDTLSSFIFSYNLNDHITNMSTSRSEITVNPHLNYLYDETNQLISATKPQEAGAETFSYDLSGNRLQRDGDTQDSAFSDRNELTNDKAFSYTYDRNGNLTQKTHLTTGEITEYEWDYENQLASIKTKINAMSNPVTVVSYKYDALGRRIAKETQTEATKYIYDRDHILLEFNTDDLLGAKYVTSQLTDEVMFMERPKGPHTKENFSRQRYYYHRDQLGSVTEVTNSVGEVIQRYVYDSFGRVKLFGEDGLEITSTSSNYLENPFAFTGREYDSETGLYYYRARYYNPDTGRFLSEDPIGEPCSPPKRSKTRIKA